VYTLQAIVAATIAPTVAATIAPCIRPIKLLKPRMLSAVSVYSQSSPGHHIVKFVPQAYWFGCQSLAGLMACMQLSHCDDGCLFGALYRHVQPIEVFPRIRLLVCVTLSINQTYLLTWPKQQTARPLTPRSTEGRNSQKVKPG